MLTALIGEQDSFHHFNDLLEETMTLLCCCEECRGVPTNEVLNANDDLFELLRGKSTFIVIAIASHEVDHLRQQVPEFNRNTRLLITSVVDEDVDAVKAFLYRF